MKKIAIITAALTVVLAAPAYSQSVPERTGINSALGVAPKTEAFVKEVAISDMFEIESSKLAQDRADAKSKTFAGKMIQDHTETSTELKSLVQSGKVKADVPAALDKPHASKLDKLRSQNGKDFDKNYDSMQVSAHKDAVNLFDRYSKGGDNADLKAFAAKHLPHLQDHLKMAQDLKK
jgi:putative membrane protein